MNLRTTFILGLLAVSLPLMASETKTASIGGENKTAAQRYGISLGALYGWNGTWGNMGGFNLDGHMPINRHFELDAAFEYHNPSVCALTAVARPKFPLPVGELFLEGGIHSRFMCCYDIVHFVTSGSIGYRMDYVSAQIGCSMNMLCDMKTKYVDGKENLCEPFNLTYRLAVNVRPATSCWNISLGAANFTEYEYERTWQPIFFIGGHYDINRNFSVKLRSDFKPSGMFNMAGQFWGAYVRAGVTYLFQ